MNILTLIIVCMNQKKLMLSFVLPAYNEENNIEHVYQEIVNVMRRDYSEYEYEVILVDDGSEDATWQEIV